MKVGKNKMGKLVKLGRDSYIINVDTLESGTKIMWCDITINRIIERDNRLIRYVKN